MQFFPKACQLRWAHCIREWSRGQPKKIKSGRKIERIILVGYYRKLISDIGKTAEILYSLLNKSKKLEWSTECKGAVTELEKHLC